MIRSKRVTGGAKGDRKRDNAKRSAYDQGRWEDMSPLR